jgi:hypothetical protein
MSPINLPLWDRAKWKGTGVAVVTPDAPPILALAFENFDAGKKIFRGWRRRIGAQDRDGWLSVTIITGIDRKSPLNYRVVIGISESYMETALKGNRWFAMVYRMHDMTPSSGNNLEALRKQFGRTRSVQLIPGQFNRAALGFEMTQENFALGIQLSQLEFVQAWQVGGNSPLLTAMRGITDPVLPAGVEKAPFVDALERFKARATGASGRPH